MKSLMLRGLCLLALFICLPSMGKLSALQRAKLLEGRSFTIEPHASLIERWSLGFQGFVIEEVEQYALEGFTGIFATGIISGSTSSAARTGGLAGYEHGQITFQVTVGEDGNVRLRANSLTWPSSLFFPNGFFPSYWKSEDRELISTPFDPTRPANIQFEVARFNDGKRTISKRSTFCATSILGGHVPDRTEFKTALR